MTDETRKLTPANENPWYVLMTLHGESGGEGKWDDGETADMNRWAWNAWATQHYSLAELSQAGIDTQEFGAWSRNGKEIEKLFFQVLEEREWFDPTGILIPDPADVIDMSSLYFERPFNISKFIIPSDMDVMGSKFKEVALFDEALCLGKFRGAGATFHMGAHFDQTICVGSLSFSDAVFEDVCSFSKMKVQGRSYFSGARFKRATDFVFTQFDKGVNFAGSTFERGGLFRNMKVQGNAEFSTSMFKGRADFAEAKFLVGKENRDNRLRFAGAIFDGPVSFRQTVFEASYPDFDGAVLHNVMTFTARDELWPNSDVPDVTQAKESCATIRHAVAKQGLPEDEHFFFRREMHFASQIGGWWRRLPYRLFGEFSNYGESIARPMRALVELFTLGAVALFGTLLATKGWVAALGLAVSVSFSNLLPLFGFGRTFLKDTLMGLPPLLQFMSAAQTVLALPLLFFLGLGLRKRFRLR